MPSDLGLTYLPKLTSINMLTWACQKAGASTRWLLTRANTMVMMLMMMMMMMMNDDDVNDDHDNDF